MSRTFRKIVPGVAQAAATVALHLNLAADEVAAARDAATPPKGAPRGQLPALKLDEYDRLKELERKLRAIAMSYETDCYAGVEAEFRVDDSRVPFLSSTDQAREAVAVLDRLAVEALL